jgi:hypothetical protein
MAYLCMPCGYFWPQTSENAAYGDECLEDSVYERTRAFLVAMREQVRGSRYTPEDGLLVEALKAAGAVGIEYRSPEYYARLAELENAGYIVPHWQPVFRRQGAFLITPGGIAAADGLNEA